MKPLDKTLRQLVGQWIAKAERDFEAASFLMTERDRFREVIAFHCQQTVEKFIKAILVRYQIEFKKSHDIRSLAVALLGVHPELSVLMEEADQLTPFGVEVRYPGDAPELLPGAEQSAYELASRVRDAARDLLRDYLDGNSSGSHVSAPGL